MSIEEFTKNLQTSLMILMSSSIKPDTVLDMMNDIA